MLDFEELEKVTIYDNGYYEDHPVIKNFWEVVHSLSVEEKKKLLFFATGSDRSPIGGLGKLTFVITRHGPDSDRLPSAHTCFNHLLLPEYNTKDKLKDRLLASINNAEGFGLM
jgi:ubiquitin-protein ligase E3 A